MKVYSVKTKIACNKGKYSAFKYYLMYTKLICGLIKAICKEQG